MHCIYCQGTCIKRGKRKNSQRYQCKECGKSFLQEYTKPVIGQDKCDWVLKLQKENCSIGSISRLLNISKSSVKRIIDRHQAQSTVL